jgi:cellulose synthase/poly-beta-1,6-N-acetylglucosamine synthase-like glycosyltransferase
MNPSTITVLIPTYRRVQDLKRCLNALKQQSRPVDEVVIIVRDTDSETWTFLETFHAALLNLHTVRVTVPGVVAALNLGLESAQGEIIAITDDDAEPHIDWLERLEAHFFLDDKVGGVGGRDWVYHGTQLEVATQQRVGQVQWFGRMIGNHHIGIGEAREVDLLKGANMSYRRSAIAGLRCDTRLKGTGAQVHFEVALSLSVRQRGWKLIYDPAVAVNHYPAQRFDEDGRVCFSTIAATNLAHNETIVLLDYFSPLRRVIYLLWATAIGTRSTPGLVQLLRFLPRERSLAVHKFLASIQGRWLGWQTWRTTDVFTKGEMT